MDLESTILSEISQAREKHHMITLVCGIYEKTKQTKKKNQQQQQKREDQTKQTVVDTESELVVA